MLFIKTYLVSFFLLLTSLLIGQHTTWEEDFYKSNRSDDFQQIVEDWEGNLAMIGNTNGWGAKGEDILFWKIAPSIASKYLKNKARNRIGTKEDERAFTIIKTFDGGYLIGGYTTTKRDSINKQKDPLLIKLDENGEPLHWYDDVKAIGGLEDDAINDLFLQEDGSIIAVGHKGNSVLIIKIKPNGDLLEKTIYGYRSEAFAVASNKLDELVITGTWSKQFKKEIFITKVVFQDNDLKVVWDYRGIRKGKIQIKTGLDIEALSEGGYAIIGKGINEQKEQKMCLIKVPEKNRRRGGNATIYLLGGNGDSGGTAISETLDKNLLLTGYTNGHKRGARRNRGWVQLVNQTGKDIWKESGLAFGDRQDDELQDIIQTSTGKIFAAGYTNSTEGFSTDAWMLQLEKSIVPPTINNPNLSIEDFSFSDANQNDTLDANERGYVLFKVRNNGPEDIANVQAQLKVSTIRGLAFPRTVIVGKVPAGKTTLVSVPLKSLPNVVSFNCQLDVALTVNNKTITQTKSPFSFLTERAALPDLQIIRVDTIDFKSTFFRRRKEIKLKVKVQNTGKVAAENVYLKFVYPFKVQAINTKEYQLGNIEVGETKELTFNFKALSYYNLDSIKIQCLAIERRHNLYFNRDYTVKLVNYFKDHRRRVNSNTPIKENRGPNGNFDYWLKDYGSYTPKVDWESPTKEERNYLKNEYYNYNNSIALKLQVEWDQPLQVDAISLNNKHNKEVYRDFKIDAINIDSGYIKEEKYYDSYVSLTVNLKEGLNKIQIAYGFQKTDIVEINYIPFKPTLHLFSIGVPYSAKTALPKLNYTTKDAKDFATSFEEQKGKGKLFKDAIIHVINSESTTEIQQMRGLIESIGRKTYFINDDDKPQEIEKGDVVILFISGHGEEDFSEFIVPASNYNEYKPGSTSLNFQTDILKYLNAMEGVKKLLFVDACHSGTIEGTKETNPKLSEAIAILANESPENEYQFFLSCHPKQRSFENKKWENGAFTEALLELFGKTPEDKKAREKLNTIISTAINDQNQIILNTDKIMEYLEYRVPELVRSVQKREVQKPFMPEKQRKNPLPIFILNRQ